MSIGVAEQLQDAAVLAAQLPDVLVRAEHLAHTLWQGQHARRRTGVGDAFWQYRPYTSGDSVTRIDWRRSARTDTLYVRECEQQSLQPLLVWTDLSSSMHYASAQHPTKVSYALQMILALAFVTLRGGDSVRYLTDKMAVQQPSQLPAFVTEMIAATGHSSHPSLSEGQNTTQPFIIASDFLGDDAVWDGVFQRLSARPRRGVLLHVFDPAEITLPFTGRVQMQGLEGEDPFLVPNINALRDLYQKRVQSHQDRLKAIAEGQGWLYITCMTDTPPLALLLKAVNYLSY